MFSSNSYGSQCKVCSDLLKTITCVGKKLTLDIQPFDENLSDTTYRYETKVGQARDDQVTGQSGVPGRR